MLKSALEVYLTANEQLTLLQIEKVEERICIPSKKQLERSEENLKKKVSPAELQKIRQVHSEVIRMETQQKQENKTLHYYNSLNGVNNLQYFRPLLKNVFEGKIVEHQTPQQDNGIDCGLYVIAITELLNVPLFRKMLEESEDYFADLSTETTSKRDAEIDQIRGIIASAQTIFDKSKATKEELEQVISSLKTLTKAASGLTEKLNKQNIANSSNSNNTIPQTETKPEGGKEKPVDNTVKPDSGRDNTNPNKDANHKPKPTNSPPNLNDKVQQDIQQGQEKTKNNLKNDISKAKHGTDEDKFNAIKNFGGVLGEQGFEEEKSELATIEEELAINNPSKYLEAIRAKIEENLKKNKLTIEELDSEIQADYQNIEEDNVDKIIENIGKSGAKKRIKNFKEKISKVAKLGKAKVQKLKEKLLRFIRSKNKYEQACQKEAQNLLARLEKNSQVQQSKPGFPTG
ncbi:5160_t:CDS:2 [Funneliformis geosporum]|nr:5160_t:CDS:2 [Funneliformis geosporum]